MKGRRLQPEPACLRTTHDLPVFACAGAGPVLHSLPTPTLSRMASQCDGAGWQASRTTGPHHFFRQEPRRPAVWFDASSGVQPPGSCLKKSSPRIAAARSRTRDP